MRRILSWLKRPIRNPGTMETFSWPILGVWSETLIISGFVRTWFVYHIWHWRLLNWRKCIEWCLMVLAFDSFLKRWCVNMLCMCQICVSKTPVRHSHDSQTIQLQVFRSLPRFTAKNDTLPPLVRWFSVHPGIRWDGGLLGVSVSFPVPRMKGVPGGVGKLKLIMESLEEILEEPLHSWADFFFKKPSILIGKHGKTIRKTNQLYHDSWI